MARPAYRSQHCPSLDREQRAVLDEAQRKYGVPWHVTANKHYKVYLGDTFVTVLSLGNRNGNRMAPVSPATRLRKQIEHAMSKE